MKTTTLLGIATAATLSLVLSTGPAQAAQRDVIADAAVICAGSPAHPQLQAACDLVFKTNGQEVFGNGCNPPSFDSIDNGYVDYLGRNCADNEGALLRKASSAVLSLRDYLVKGKLDQASIAAGYLCTYSDSFNLLLGAGKLKSTEDLAADAENIVKSLGFICP